MSGCREKEALSLAVNAGSGANQDHLDTTWRKSVWKQSQKREAELRTKHCTKFLPDSLSLWMQLHLRLLKVLLGLSNYFSRKDDSWKSVLAFHFCFEAGSLFVAVALPCVLWDSELRSSASSSKHFDAQGLLPSPLQPPFVSASYTSTPIKCVTAVSLDC